MTLSLAMAFAAGLQFAALHIGPDNDFTREWHWCLSEHSESDPTTPEQTVRGCTTIIKSPRTKPTDLEVAYVYRGAAYFHLHDCDHAIADFTQAIEMDSHDPNAFHGRGLCLQVQGQFTRAIEDYNAAIRLQPDWTQVFIDRGGAYLLAGDVAHAVEDFDHAARLRPDAETFGRICWARAVAAQQLDLALSNCNQALSLRRNYYEAVDSRGFVYFRLNQFDKALADYNAILAALPKNAPALYMRGVVRRRLGDNGGDADIAAATAIDPTIAATYARYGVTP